MVAKGIMTNLRQMNQAYFYDINQSKGVIHNDVVTRGMYWLIAPRYFSYDYIMRCTNIQ
jgi:hypothetical protein